MLRDVEIAALRNAVRSLAESTELLVESAGVLAVLRGRNSPYASHRTVEYAHSQNDGPIIIANRRRILIVSPTCNLVPTNIPLTIEEMGERWGWDDERDACWFSSEIPALLVEPVISVLRRYGLVGQTSALVRAAWPVPVLERWDEEGRPVYRVRSAPSLATVAEG